MKGTNVLPLVNIMQVVMKEKKKDVMTVIILMAVLWGGYVSTYILSFPLHTSTDELGALVSAAKLAGRDWREVIDCCGYYGFGWYGLFFFIFLITDSPIVIYRTIIAVSAVLRVLIIPIALFIIRKYGNLSNKKEEYVLAFFSAVLSPSVLGTISNEYPLEIIFWCVVLLLCETFRSKGLKKAMLSGLLVLAMTYAMLLHTRALTIIIAVFLTAFIYSILRKTIAIHPVAIVLFPALYFYAKKIVALYQSVIWIGSDGVRNSAVHVTSNIGLFDTKSWIIWINMILGNLTTEMLLTGGVFSLAIIFFIYKCVRLTLKKEKLTDKETSLFVIIIVSVLCMGATIAAFCVSSWFEGMKSTWGNADAGKLYTYKGLDYVRYWNVYMPPFVVAVLLLNKDRSVHNKLIRVNVVFFISCILLYMHMILPIIQNNSSAASFLFSIGGFSENTNISREYYIKVVAISMLVMIVFSFLLTKESISKAVLLLVIFTLFNQGKESIQYNNTMKGHMYDMIDASYSLKEKVENMGVDLGEIYFYDKSTTNDNNWKIYAVGQFYFNRYTAHYYSIDQEIEKNDLIICNKKTQDITSQNKNIHCYVLDKNEIWYTYLDLDSFF